MAVRTRDEIMSMINARLGEDTSDDALAIIEDLTDTLDDLETRAADSTDWEARYNQLDQDWRTRYRERFFNAEYQPEDPDEFEDNDDPEPEKTKFEDLFEVKED